MVSEAYVTEGRNRISSTPQFEMEYYVPSIRRTRATFTEYIIYLKVSTINLNFLLSWFFGIVLEATVTRSHGCELNHLTFKVEYLAHV